MKILHIKVKLGKGSESAKNKKTGSAIALPVSPASMLPPAPEFCADFWYFLPWEYE